MNVGGKIISYIVLVIAIVVGVKFLPSIPISSVVTQKQSDFTVSGTGKVTAVPDTGIISLGMQVSKPTVKQAQSEANRVVNQVIETLKKLEIAEKDIKTENYSIYPEYDYTSGKNRISGYHVSANLVVTVRDLDKINDVIDQSAGLGINTVNNINLTINEDKLKELQKQARSEAVKEAKAKAENLSSAADMTLGRITNITESDPWIPRPMMMAVKEVGLGGAGDTTNIQPGSTDIISTITLTYETR